MISYYSKKPIGVKLGIAMFILQLLLLTITLWLAANQGANIFLRRQINEMLNHGRKLTVEIKNSTSPAEIKKILGYWGSISGYALAVTDHQGKIIFTSDQSHLSVNNILSEAREVKDKEPLIRSEIHPNFGQEMVSVYIPFKDGRRLVLHHTVLETSQIINNMRYSLFIIGVIIFFIGILLSFLISFWLVRPVECLIKAAKAMGNGNFQVRAPVEQQDEIGQLARAFNQMAQDLALEEDRRDQFLADVSHELRSPLFVIQANAEAALDGIIADNEKALKTIIQEVEKLKIMVNDLRELSLVGAHDLWIGTEEFDLVIVLQRVVERFIPLAIQRKIDIEIDSKVKALMLKGEGKHWEKVFYNLIDNALRYTSERGKIKIILQNINNHVEIEVKDTGPGLNQKDIPFLWERFYKCEAARTRNTSGMGLGLALVKEVVTAYGGQVEARNGSTGGACFIIALPN